MGYLPLFLDVTGKPCLVIGGGEIAERKIAALRDAGATVTVVSPEVNARLRALAVNGAIHHIERRYANGDVRGCVLVYVATSDGEANREAAAEAQALGVPVNVADVPDLCSFIAPAVVRRGLLQLAVSTGGASPALAKLLRAELAAAYGPEYEPLLEILAAARRYLARHEPVAAARARILSALVASGLRDCLGQRNFAAVDEMLREHLGAGMTELGCDPARMDTAPSSGGGAGR
ncbi:MAG: precorrin-2 dehydrogenase/sirohydrochlorin ferrochelatase family protein [Candidatus Binataceae bacterium]